MNGNVSAFFIKRPAFTIVMSLILVVIGGIGFVHLPIRWMPDVKLPVVSIQTLYSGASATLIEQAVTKPIENAMGSVNGIDTLVSSTSRGVSHITASFKLGYDLDTAVADIRDSLNKVRLPRDVNLPIISKAKFSKDALMFIAFFDEEHDMSVFSQYIKSFIIPTLETIHGVGGINVFGERSPAMRIWLNPIEMAEMQVTVDDILRSLNAQDIEFPTGQIRGLDRWYDVITDIKLQTPLQFSNLIVRHEKDRMVRLKEVAKIVWGVQEQESAFRLNGRPGIALQVIAQSAVNPLDVSQAIEKQIAVLTPTLPKSLQVKILFNSADNIRASLQGVYKAFFEAVFCVWLIILVFLGSFRATLIPIVTIPVCLISTFSLLYFLNFSINTITLMALVLAIGLVVDDAIVVLENINRHIEAGSSSLIAALQGSSEVIFPIIGMTMTLAAVYIPIAFTPGLLGILFREFTVTLAGAVIISGVIALSLSPMMCARLLTPSTLSSSREGRWIASQLACLEKLYSRMLIRLIDKRYLVAIGLLLFCIVGLSLYALLPAELAPSEDTHKLIAMITPPRNASYQYTNASVRRLEGLYAHIPDIDFYFSTVHPEQSIQYIQLKSNASSQRTTNEWAIWLQQEASKIPGVEVNIFSDSSSSSKLASHSSNSHEIEMVITTTGDYLRLQQVTDKVIQSILLLPGVQAIHPALKWDSQQLAVRIDRDRADHSQVNILDVIQTLSTLLAGQTVGQNDDENIIVQMQPQDLSDPNSFDKMYVRNALGDMVPLAQLLRVQNKTAPSTFDHFDRLRANTLSVILAPEIKLANAIHLLKTAMIGHLPADMHYTFTGEAKQFLESLSENIFIFGLAILFIYLVLVAQFESFTDPFIILLTVPFAAIGAMILLKLLGGSFNIYSNIGLVTLIGLIAKHGILMTEFANRLRECGQPIRSAILQAALLRLRPILMTTGAMVLGAIPLALSVGSGAESRQSIGLVISGGLTIGTFFSLLVIPIAYTYLAPLHPIALNASLISSGEDVACTQNQMDIDEQDS